MLLINQSNIILLWSVYKQMYKTIPSTGSSFPIGRASPEWSLDELW